MGVRERRLGPGRATHVGVVRVLWLPFFYYPADEVFFHPVIGYRSREGAFVQTTSYLLGEERRDRKESGLLSLMSNMDNSGPLERSGVFIRRTSFDTDTGDGSSDVAAGKNRHPRLLADVCLPRRPTSFRVVSRAWARADSASAGLSRALFLQSNVFIRRSTIRTAHDSLWTAQLSARSSLSLRRQFYSSGLSKEISVSFQDRSSLLGSLLNRLCKESSSILSIIEANKTSVSRRSAMNQSVTTSLFWRFPQGKDGAVLETIEVSNLGAQMNWRTKSQSTTGLDTAGKRRLAVSPSRDFFYPDSLKFLDGTIKLSGTLDSFDRRAKLKEAVAAPASPQEDPKPAAAEASPQGGESTTGAKSEQGFDHERSLGLTASGVGDCREKYRSTAWLSPEDVDASLHRPLDGRGAGL